MPPTSYPTTSRRGQCVPSTATLATASVKVWQYDDEGDVRGILTKDCPDNFDKDGKPLR
jgi:hypothetical protein